MMASSFAFILLPFTQSNTSPCISASSSGGDSRGKLYSAERILDQKRSPNQLTQKTFDQALSSGKLKLALIGMSNTGKSHRAKQLSNDMKFDKISIDEQIENELVDDLKTQGYAGIEGLASWMGLPFEPQYPKNVQKYLDLEDKLTSQSCSYIPNTNLVVDTTGSVIHLRPETLNLLRENFLVIHLEASVDMVEAMMKRFFQHPKPVAWGPYYAPEANEDPQKALRRCYPTLLTKRREAYNRVAHVTIRAAISTNPHTSIDKLLSIVADSLPKR